MSIETIPFNLTSRQALIELIRKTHPRLNLVEKYARFDPPYHAPTEDFPGRTFIEVEQTDRNLKRWYVYRRLDFNVKFLGQINIKLASPITPRRIVEEINRSRGMCITDEDVELNDTPIETSGHNVLWTMEALPNSYRWVGSVPVSVEPLDRPTNVRLTEDGAVRLNEDGSYRLLEIN